MYGSRVRARTRRHSSTPSISGMYQSEITIGMRASCSSSHASRPLWAVFTSYPAALARAPSCELETASSSTTSTGIALTIPAAFHRGLKVSERRGRLTAHPLQLVTRPGHVTPGGRGAALPPPRGRRGAAPAHAGGGGAGGGPRRAAVGVAAFDHREQLVGLERLGKVAGHAPLQAALALAAQRVRRQGDDRERAALRQGANPRRRLAPVHLGR